MNLTTDVHLPTQIPNYSNIIQAAGGDFHTLALEGKPNYLILQFLLVIYEKSDNKNKKELDLIN